MSFELQSSANEMVKKMKMRRREMVDESGDLRLRRTIVDGRNELGSGIVVDL